MATRAQAEQLLADYGGGFVYYGEELREALDELAAGTIEPGLVLADLVRKVVEAERYGRNEEW